MSATRYVHGSRVEWKVGDLIQPGPSSALGEQGGAGSFAWLTPNLDGAIWEAELAPGVGPARVYTVEPTGPVEDASILPGYKPVGHPAMTHRSCRPLRVTGEVVDWMLFHGTKAALKAGDLIQTGQRPNFGNLERTTTYVYCSRTLDAATWGAELATGDGPGRIYVVEPTGPIEEDPNLTDKKFRGNPTKSFRSRDPLRVIREIPEWKGHAPEVLKAMQAGVARAARLGVEPIDD